MPTYPQEISARAFALRLAAFYAAMFIAIGVQLPFLPVWLAAKGLDANLIGIVLALPMIVRVFAIPMTTRLADHRDVLRGTIVIATAATVIGYTALGLAGSAVTIMLLYTLASAALVPVMPLTDAYALRGLARYGRAYGPVRLWGSAAFIVGSLGAGFLLDVTEAKNLIWFVVAPLGLTAAAACALMPAVTRDADAPAEVVSAWQLLRDPAFALVVAAASLIQGSHAVYYGFSTLDWQAAGLDNKMIGALWALGVLAEIVLFALSGRLPRALHPTVLMVIGACGAFVRWSAMAANPPTAVLPFLQCLHALSFAATHLGTLGFMVRAAPARWGATAQGYLAVALGVVMGAAIALAGVLYGRFGALAYGAMALMSLAGMICAIGARRMARA